jgi:hypothetical protein
LPVPILDVEIVSDAGPEPGLARRIAAAAAEVLTSPPGTLWVKVRRLDPGAYTENAGDEPRPVFISVLQRTNPGAAADEHARLAAALAQTTGIPVECLRVTYEPAAAGRQSFGGRLIE